MDKTPGVLLSGNIMSYRERERERERELVGGTKDPQGRFQWSTTHRNSFQVWCQVIGGAQAFLKYACKKRPRLHCPGVNLFGKTFIIIYKVHFAFSAKQVTDHGCQHLPGVVMISSNAS